MSRHTGHSGHTGHGALVVALVVAWTAAGGSHADDDYAIRVYPCAYAYETLTINGLLDEGIWTRTPETTSFAWYGKAELADVQTSLQWAYDDTHLYIAVMCDEPTMNRLTPVSQPRDAHAVFQGETIEIFVDPDHDHGRYYQIAVNAAASIYDSHGTDPAWSADVKAATRLGADTWTMEVAVPWADLKTEPKPGAIVGVNACRDRYLGPDKQWSNWSRTQGGFHDPARFGHLVLSPSIETIAGLEAELRMGGRRGPIAIDGPDRFVNAAYRALAAKAIAATEQWVSDLEQAGRTETNQATKQALAERIKAYRAELAGFRHALAAEVAPERSAWTEMTARLGDIRREIDRVIWEARLEGLLAEI